MNGPLDQLIILGHVQEVKREEVAIEVRAQYGRSHQQLQQALTLFIAIKLL